MTIMRDQVFPESLLNPVGEKNAFVKDERASDTQLLRMCEFYHRPCQTIQNETLKLN